jgi:D-alanine-D-alanine ligase
MEIGIAYDLKEDFVPKTGGPEDQLEEYDSESTVAGIESALQANGHRTRRLGGGRRLVERVLEAPPDLVFNIAEGYGTRSREAHVPAVLEMLGIPFTHSDPLTLALTLDKALAKKVVGLAGVPTPRFAVVEREADLDAVERGGQAAAPLQFPVMVKPLFEGSSMGIRKSSRVTCAAELRELAMRLLAEYRQPVLVEEFCPGPELTVGLLGEGAGASVIGMMEIVPRVDRPEEFVYSLEVKRNYLVEVEYRVPPALSARLLDAAASVALAAYRALGCRDVSRVDLRVGRDGEPKFLEVNPLPGLNPTTGDIVILSGRCGIGYDRLIGRIVEVARRRLGI